MKKWFICLACIVYAYAMHAQNSVGVNTTNPQASLDVRGSQRVGGNNNYIHFDSATGRIQWIGAALYAPASQQIIRHSGSSEGLYAGGGRLEYRNTSEPVFYSDWTNGNGYFKNNLGIGSLNPFAPLTFSNANGPKISLSGASVSPNGIGVQDDILQMYSTSTPGSGIAFGYYFNSAFGEIMRIETTRGRVGIGTSAPKGMLHLSNGTSGVNPLSSSTLIVESSSSAYMNLLSPSTAESGIVFGPGNNSASGAIIFGNSFTPNGFQFRNNGNETKMVLDNFGRLGIGTINPGVRLHVSGGPSGGTPFAGAQLGVENLGHTYISMLSPDANETGIVFGKSSNAVSGGIIYNNSATLNGIQFRNNGNVTRMVLDDQGRLGIGNNNPNAPLAFPPALGKKITLYPGATGDVGLSVQGNLLQIYSDNPNADIAFGYDQGGVLIERMRIKGNGNVGIGVSDPALRLDISGRMRIRPGSDGDAGIWLNNTANTGFASFMGLQSDNYVGFFGAGVGWAFTMNNQTGALKINGSEGQAGQVIQSSGGGTAPSWASSTNALYNNTFQVTSGTPGVIAVAPGSPAFVPGMSSTFNLVGNAKVMIQFNVAAVTSCTSCWGNVSIVIYCDGNLMRSFGWRIFESSSLTLSASHLLTLPPGSHTISLFAIATSITVNFGSVAGTNPIFQDTMVIQIIPQ